MKRVSGIAAFNVGIGLNGKVDRWFRRTTSCEALEFAASVSCSFEFRPRGWSAAVIDAPLVFYVALEFVGVVVFDVFDERLDLPDL